MPPRSNLAPAVLAGLVLIPLAWRRLWGAVLLFPLICAVASYLGLLAPGASWRIPVLGVLMAALMMAQGGLYRLALDRGSPGAAGLQWSVLESRLCAVVGLNALFITIMAALVAVLLLAASYGVASSGVGFVRTDPTTWGDAATGRGGIVLGLIAAACAGFLLWAQTRVSLGAAQTCDEGRLVMLSSWPLTRGRVVPLMLGMLAITLPLAGLEAWLLSLARFSLASPVPGFVPTLAASWVISGVWLPSMAGLMAYHYRQAQS